MREALRNRDFRLLFAGQAVSAIGDQIFPIAITVQVLDHGGGVGDLGLVLAARTAALVLFALLGGVWADRLPRVRVLIGADALRLVAVLALALAMSGTTSTLVYAALAFLVGGGEAFFRPAFGSLIPSVLPSEQLNAGNALSGTTFHVAAIIGPGLAGVLVAATDPKTALLLDSATFAWSLAMLLQVREPGRELRERKRIHQEMAEGIAAVRRRPWVAAVLLMATTQLLLVLPATTVLLPQAVKDTGAETSTYGYVLAIGAAGGLLGALIAGHVHPKRPGLVGLTALLTFMLEPLALLLDAPIPVLAAGWFLAALGLGPFLVYWETGLQKDVEPELLARVISLDWMCSFALMPVGLAAVGPVIERVGEAPVLWVALVACVIPPLACLPVRGAIQFRTVEAPPSFD